MTTLMRSLPIPTLLLVAALGAGCSAGPSGSTGPTPSPTATSIDSPEAAARAVSAGAPLFGGFKAKDPAAIGQSSWYEAARTEAAKPPTDWKVVFSAGWGDCPAGCINVHAWTYIVRFSGTVEFQSETGPAVPAEVIAPLAAAVRVTGAGGRVTSGPSCGGPARPDSSACADRPVQGAVLVVKGAGGTEVARVTTDASGLFRLSLQPGDYTLEPQPVTGFLGTAPPMPFSVMTGAETFLDVRYDTGMR